MSDRPITITDTQPPEGIRIETEATAGDHTFIVLLKRRSGGFMDADELIEKIARRVIELYNNQ